MLRINLSLLRYSSLKSSTCQWNTWKGLRSTRNSIRSIETSVSRVALRVDRREFASISSIASLSLANTAVYVGALCNAGLAASKGFIGISIGSTALVADAANSIGDLLSDVVVFFSLNAARQGTSENKPWGLGKLEPLGALSVGVLLLATGGGVCFSAVQSVVDILFASPPTAVMAGTFELIDPRKAGELFEQGSLLTYSALGVSLSSIVIKEGLFRYTIKAGRSVKSDALIANAYQHRADVLLSTSVLFGLVGSMLGYPVLDPLAGILVSVVILNQGIRTVVEAVKDLIDSPASAEETSGLVDTCKSVPGVLSVERLRARKSGPYLFVEVKVGVDGAMSASAAHRVARLTKFALLEKHEDRVANAIVHVFPIGANGMGDMAPTQSRDHREVLLSVETLLKPIAEIQSVSEVQLYYTDDGHIRIKVDVCMHPHLTIREAHLVAMKAENVIAGSLSWAKSIDVDLELHERGTANTPT